MADCLQCAKTNQLFPFFIPQVKPQGLQTVTDVKRPDCLQGGYVVAALLQMVIGDAGSNVVDVSLKEKLREH